MISQNAAARLIDFSWNPSANQLKQFGILSALVLPFVAWLWSATPETIQWMFAIGLALASIGWLRPNILKPLFILLSLIAYPIGIIVGELALVTIYYGLFFPIGFLLRRFGHDPLDLRRKAPATTSRQNSSAQGMVDPPSFWITRKTTAKPASYFQQF